MCVESLCIGIVGPPLEHEIKRIAFDPTSHRYILTLLANKEKKLMIQEEDVYMEVFSQRESILKREIPTIGNMVSRGDSIYNRIKSPHSNGSIGRKTCTSSIDVKGGENADIHKKTLKQKDK